MRAGRPPTTVRPWAPAGDAAAEQRLARELRDEARDAAGEVVAEAAFEEVEPLDPAHAARGLAAVLPVDDEHGEVGLTPGKLRAAARARRSSWIRRSPGDDTWRRRGPPASAVVLAWTVWAASSSTAPPRRGPPPLLRSGPGRKPWRSRTPGSLRVRRRSPRSYTPGLRPDPRPGRDRVPVNRNVDLAATGGSAVWTVDVRLPAAVALGLSDHPALLAG
ncbi:MAG: hypothetical protein M3P93_02000 [Actinomycetota bacterium]|nr:hypothetical protein [Actinomycetota bacterium]